MGKKLLKAWAESSWLERVILILTLHVVVSIVIMRMVDDLARDGFFAWLFSWKRSWLVVLIVAFMVWPFVFGPSPPVSYVVSFVDAVVVLAGTVLVWRNRVRWGRAS